MHFKKLFTIALCILSLSFFSCSSVGHDKVFKQDLENLYCQFLNALETGNDEVIKGVMSSSFYASTKNDYADAKEPFALSMKKIGETYPPPSDLDFIKVFKKGPTAGLLYSKDADSSKVFGRPMLTFLFVKFVRENNVWKAEAVEPIDVEKYNSDGSLTAFEESFLSKESVIDGHVREAPPLIAEAEISGILEVFANGVQTDVFVNGLHQGAMDEISTLRYVHGGLKFGENRVEIVCKELPEYITKSIDISIKAKGKDDFLEVFQYEANEKIQKKYVSTFTVSREIVHKRMSN